MTCCEHDTREGFVCALQTGAKVPGFSIEVYNPVTREMEEISLESIGSSRKWTVLFFYPADFTFVCPTELADLATQHETLKSLGVEVISVSTDTTYCHLAWKDTELLLKNVKFLMGSDPTGEVCRLFGVYDANTGLALRGTCIIDPESVLVSTEVNYYNVGRNGDELVRKMEANVHLRAHPNEVCPARWQKGQTTLTPDNTLVGKVADALK